jgi:hypothetical protein
MPNITQHTSLYKRYKKNLFNINNAIASFKYTDDKVYSDAYMDKLENRRDRLVKLIETLEKAYLSID